MQEITSEWVFKAEEALKQAGRVRSFIRKKLNIKSGEQVMPSNESKFFPG